MIKHKITYQEIKKNIRYLIPKFYLSHKAFKMTVQYSIGIQNQHLNKNTYLVYE